MNNQRYSLELRGEAVRQVVERGYIVGKGSGNLGVSESPLVH